TLDRSSLLFGIEPDAQVMLLSGSPFFSPPAPVKTLGSPFLPGEHGGDAKVSKDSGSAWKSWTVVPAGACTAPPGPQTVSQAGSAAAAASRPVAPSRGAGRAPADPPGSGASASTVASSSTAANAPENRPRHDRCVDVDPRSPKPPLPMMCLHTGRGRFHDSLA